LKHNTSKLIFYLTRGAKKGEVLGNVDKLLLVVEIHELEHTTVNRSQEINNWYTFKDSLFYPKYS
jgi:hypothetical protein